MAIENAGFVIRPTISAPQSRTMIDAAVAEAEAMSVAVTVVVVDESGSRRRCCGWTERRW